MGWRAITREGEELTEEKHGRPVAAGDEGKLLVIAQEDFGHNVAVDLTSGIIFIDYESLSIQNGTLELVNDKFRFWICEETNIVGEMFHLAQEIVYARDENRRRVIHKCDEDNEYFRSHASCDDKGRFIQVRNDLLTPLLWRPIWFTRWTNGVPVKVIGAQTTLPEMQGGKNVKKMVSIFSDGRIGID